MLSSNLTFSPNAPTFSVFLLSLLYTTHRALPALERCELGGQRARAPPEDNTNDSVPGDTTALLFCGQMS